MKDQCFNQYPSFFSNINNNTLTPPTITFPVLPTENGEQITQYGEHMKQWGDTINNIFPNKKIHLKQWNPTFHVLNTNITCFQSSNIPVHENKSNSTYQVMGRQNQSHKTLYKIIFKKNIFKNLQTYYILKTLWYMSWIFKWNIIENYPRLSYLITSVGTLDQQ